MIYETPQDEAAERAVVQKLQRLWRCEAHKFPKLNPIDWYLHRKHCMCALIEVKCKHHPLHKYPALYLDYVKYTALWHGRQAHGVPALFIVECDDALVYIDVVELPGLSVHVRGRTDRKTRDVRPCLAVPVGWFRPIVLDRPAEGAGGLQGT